MKRGLQRTRLWFPKMSLFGRLDCLLNVANSHANLNGMFAGAVVPATMTVTVVVVPGVVVTAVVTVQVAKGRSKVVPSDLWPYLDYCQGSWECQCEATK